MSLRCTAADAPSTGSGNTLSGPHWLGPDGGLKTFDFVVANFPFSTKAWSTGFDPANDVAAPLPQLAEQQAIAEALSDVDALISALDRLIAKKRAIKQGAMPELLTGRIRLV